MNFMRFTAGLQCRLGFRLFHESVEKSWNMYTKIAPKMLNNRAWRCHGARSTSLEVENREKWITETWNYVTWSENSLTGARATNPGTLVPSDRPASPRTLGDTLFKYIIRYI